RCAAWCAIEPDDVDDHVGRRRDDNDLVAHHEVLVTAVSWNLLYDDCRQRRQSHPLPRHSGANGDVDVDIGDAGTVESAAPAETLAHARTLLLAHLRAIRTLGLPAAVGLLRALAIPALGLLRALAIPALRLLGPLPIPAFRLLRTLTILALRLLGPLPIPTGRLFSPLALALRLLCSLGLPPLGLISLLPFRAFALLSGLALTALSCRGALATLLLTRRH